MMRLKSACEQRIKSCTRKNQNPIMEAALFYVLMGTGLRESEVVSLNVGQYRQKGLYDVLRHKSKRISNKIPLPQESREYLDQYLEKRNTLEDEPLFITRYGTRLQTLDIYRICQRVLKQALAFLPEQENFNLPRINYRTLF